jgi:hypothetical protein
VPAEILETIMNESTRRLCASLVVSGAFMFPWGVPPASAQPQVDPAAYRAAKTAAIATFLDKTKPTGDRLAAVAKMGYPEEKTTQALLGVGADPAEESAVRLAAFGRAEFNDAWFDAAMKILESPTDGDEEMDEKLLVLLGKRLTFTPPPAMRQRWQGALRNLLDDNRSRVRVQAYETLASDHDTLAVSRLSDALRTRQNVPVPVPTAINLLDMDGPMNHIEVLRPYLDDPDAATRAQAVHALGVDSRSRDKIVQYARDPKAPLEVRLHALRGLARQGASFPEVAIPLVEDSRADPRVRQEAMKQTVGVMNYNKIPAATQIRFADVVDRVAAGRNLVNDADRALASEAKDVRAYLVRGFPEIKRHYENR